MNSYNYRIFMVDEDEKWIFITHNDWDEPVAFVALVKKICDKCNGKICIVGDTQYKINGDKFDLIYQFDNLFGTVVIYNNLSSKSDVTEYLENIFTEL